MEWIAIAWLFAAWNVVDGVIGSFGRIGGMPKLRDVWREATITTNERLLWPLAMTVVAVVAIVFRATPIKAAAVRGSSFVVLAVVLAAFDVVLILYSGLQMAALSE